MEVQEKETLKQSRGTCLLSQLIIEFLDGKNLKQTDTKDFLSFEGTILSLLELNWQRKVQRLLHEFWFFL